MNLSYQKGIRIGTWNIRTLAQASRLAQLSKEMTRCKIKILGLSEVRWKNSGDITTSDNHYMIYSGNSTTHINGVGIVISTKIKKSLMEWNPVSDRLITARFRAKNRNITIIQCYAPTEIADDSEKDHFYNQLQSTIASAHKRDIKLVMGDFNGKIGNNNNNLDEIMGRHGLGKARNNNDERLIDLCMANRLFIGSTRFPHKDIHKYTWQAPDGVTRNQIDHVLIDKKHLKSLLDVRTMRSADMYSDHKLVVNKGERRNFCETVTAKVNNISPTISAKEKWELVQKAYVESANEVIGIKNSTRKMWITNETWDLIEQRKTLNQQLNQIRSDVTLARYNNIEKQIKKMARRDRRKFEENIINDAEVAAEQKDNSDGHILTTEQQQLNRWVEFFKHDDPTIDNCDIDYTTSSRISTKSPSVAEIRLAIKKLKNNKAAGSDGIAPELLKTDPSFAAKTLASIITEV
ncbi:PREDICTED: craniofacial development protein 2-like [Cyphomyrmex costatus]|uniref:craniofacial development protein 2-like n=1 Tax=Cyphomyrmex costatus TaxID=456900 RepID=UPI0008522F66|nr:PREDICTED: craniofacial development protein 2-like [Cyphomyrmex costatus]